MAEGWGIGRRSVVGDVHVSGVHAFLWAPQEQRSLQCLANYGDEADGSEAQSHQDRAATPEAPSECRGRKMAAQGPNGLLPIPRGSGELDAVVSVQASRISAVAKRVDPSQPPRASGTGSAPPLTRPGAS